MSNEKILIDSAELINKLPVIDQDRQISLIGAVADIITMISECTPVDAVKVIRCRDCRHYALWADGRSMHYCDKRDCTAYDDDFCSYGERRCE